MTGEGVPPFELRSPREGAATATLAPTATITPRPLPTPLARTTLTGELATPTLSPASRTWLERSGLTTAGGEDWPRVQEQARREGAVILYSDTSRAENAAASFAEAFSPLDAQALALGRQNIALRLEEGQRGEVAVADVYLASDPLRIAAMIEQQRAWNTVPLTLATVLPPGLTQPALTHHWTIYGLIYGGDALRAPLDSWWDLVRPEWQGRVALPDPIGDERTLLFLVTITQHAAELQQAYRAKFGREIVLDADCPDAGYQWIKGLLGNQPALLASDADVVRWVGGTPAAGMRLGLCGSEQLAKAGREGSRFTPFYQAVPTAGLRWRSEVVIVDRAPHPYAARLLVAWLMGDAKGGQGYAPWYAPGYYPARRDVPDPPGSVPRQELEARLWDLDLAHVRKNLTRVRDHIAAHIGRPVGGR
jgi:iron(III) transport system substrate-binding protein